MLGLTAEALGIDSENYLFHQLSIFKGEMPNLISRRQYNDRRKLTASLCEEIRKHIETNFSLLCDQFLFIRNYAKNVDGLFTRIIGKISTFTILQYLNKINNKPLDQTKPL